MINDSVNFSLSSPTSSHPRRPRSGSSSPWFWTTSCSACSWPCASSGRSPSSPGDSSSSRFCTADTTEGARASSEYRHFPSMERLPGVFVFSLSPSRRHVSLGLASPSLRICWERGDEGGSRPWVRWCRWVTLEAVLVFSTVFYRRHHSGRALRWWNLII